MKDINEIVCMVLDDPHFYSPAVLEKANNLKIIIDKLKTVKGQLIVEFADVLAKYSTCNVDDIQHAASVLGEEFSSAIAAEFVELMLVQQQLESELSNQAEFVAAVHLTHAADVYDVIKILNGEEVPANSQAVMWYRNVSPSTFVEIMLWRAAD